MYAGAGDLQPRQVALTPATPHAHFFAAHANIVGRPGAKWPTGLATNYTTARFMEFKINGGTTIRDDITKSGWDTWRLLALCCCLKLVGEISQSSDIPYYTAILAAAVKNPVTLKLLWEYSVSNHQVPLLLNDGNLENLDEKLMNEKIRAAARAANQTWGVNTMGVHGNDSKPSHEQGISKVTGRAHVSRAKGAGCFDQARTPQMRVNTHLALSMALSGDAIDPDQLKQLVFRVIQGYVPKLEGGAIEFDKRQPLCVIGTGAVGIDISDSYHYESIVCAVAFASGKPIRPMARGDRLAFRKSLHSKYAAEDDYIRRQYGFQYSLAGYAAEMDIDVWELACQVCLKTS
jgi:hypothetical protein